ncbi:bifunctional homocysteine S-methyltransferase/methylenetetrahydrofolate reductase [Pseudonocardia sp. D17]|uniref:bifunctional homocysteine S-methyltransferase/methylenetetrahydrofolate reductase n=1 Tax=Pseudonocardia sp. D17 TaxID=882661 RepID=UPI002B3B4A05|nr:bifunctional homocysteine S-methyltransferase/methylenetetrahydrofolate reductase [Pseudonocardia sp. D17]
MNVRELLTTSVLVGDGAMGTMLHAAGNSLDQALPALNLTEPELVRTIHDSYVGAGVDLVQTNTFGASRLRLAEYGAADDVARINAAGARLAREAAARADRAVLVAGSVAPAVSVHQRRRVAAEERRAAVREQVEVLVGAGVDVVLLETFGHLDELVEAAEVALEVARRTGDVPVIAQATFGSDRHTLSGHTPHEVVTALAGFPLAAMGVNCTLGPQGCLAVLRELRVHTAVPLTVQPNAGLPRRVGPARFEYDIDADYFVRYTRQLLDAGAALVGGCCGTTPSQLAAAAAAVAEHRSQRAAEVAERVAATTVVPERPETDGPFSAPGHVVAVELRPAPTGGVDEALELAAELQEAGVGLVSVAASSSPRAQVNSVDLALHLHNRLGLTTLASVTTWDRTIMALQADLLGAHALGVRGVVCETGTPPLLGDYPHVDGIWDVDSLGLIELLAGLNDGTDYHGLRLGTKTSFEIGARVNPGSRDPGRAAAGALDKIAAGAQFLITRPVHELAGLERVLEAVDGRVPVLVAVRPLTGFDEADYLAHEVPDVTIPAATLAALQDAGPDARAAGIDLAVALADQIRGMAKGVVVTGGSDVVEAVRRLLG